MGNTLGFNTELSLLLRIPRIHADPRDSPWEGLAYSFVNHNHVFRIRFIQITPFRPIKRLS